jgi:hypothetical protein
MGRSLTDRWPAFSGMKKASLGRLVKFLEKFAAAVERFGPQIFVTPAKMGTA